MGELQELQDQSQRVGDEAQTWNSRLADYQLMMLELMISKRTRAGLLERERAAICEGHH